MSLIEDTEQKQLLYFASALIEITHMPRAEGTTAGASRAPLSLSLPVFVRSGERRSHSSHLQGNRGRAGSTPNPKGCERAVPACDLKDQRAACREVLSLISRM